MPEYPTESAQVYPAWFSYKEAEVWSGLSRTTLWSLISSGHVKAAHVGRAVRISRQSLEHYMESQTKKDEVDSA
jgi:excisionase family DNA binding protein